MGKYFREIQVPRFQRFPDSRGFTVFGNRKSVKDPLIIGIISRKSENQIIYVDERRKVSLVQSIFGNVLLYWQCAFSILFLIDLFIYIYIALLFLLFMNSKSKFPNLLTLDIRPSAPSTTKRIYIFSEGTHLPAFQIPKLNLTLSLEFQYYRRKRWRSSPSNSYSCHYSRILTNRNCVDPFSTKIGITRCMELSSLLYDQHKTPIHSLDLTLDKISYKQKGILFAQPGQFQYSTPDALPKEKTLNIVRFPSSQFKYPALPSMSTFKGLKSSKLHHSLTRNSRLHLLTLSVNNYATLPSFSSCCSNSFPRLHQSIPYIGNFSTQRHLAFPLSEPKMTLFYSKPLRITTNHIDDILYMSRIQRTSITANELYILGISNFKPRNSYKRLFSTLLAVYSRNYNSSSQYSNVECNTLPSSDLSVPQVNSSSIPEPYFTNTFQPSDLQPLRYDKTYLKKPLRSIVPVNHSLGSFQDDQFAFTCVDINSTDIDVSPLPLQSSQALSDVNNIIHSAKTHKRTSPAIPFITARRNSNLIINDRISGSVMPNVNQVSSQIRLLSSSVPHSDTSPTDDSRSNYSDTPPVPVSPYHILPTAPVSNLMSTEFSGDENEILGDDICNILDALKTNSTAEYDEFVQCLHPPTNWRLSIIQSDEIVKHSTETVRPVIYSRISKSLKHPPFLTNCEDEYMEIQQNNSNIQLDNFLRGIHGITDRDTSSNMITLQKAIEESHLIVQKDGEGYIIPENDINIGIDSSVIVTDPPCPSMTKHMKTIFQNYHKTDTIKHSIQGDAATMPNNCKNSKVESELSHVVNRPITRNLEYNLSRASSDTRTLTFVKKQLMFKHNVRKLGENQAMHGYKYRSSPNGLTNLFNITQAYKYSYYIEASSNDIDTWSWKCLLKEQAVHATKYVFIFYHVILAA